MLLFRLSGFSNIAMVRMTIATNSVGVGHTIVLAEKGADGVGRGCGLILVGSK